MNIFDINKRKTWSFDEWMKNRKVAETPTHIVKGDKNEVKKEGMDEKGVESPASKGAALTDDNHKLEKGTAAATKMTYSEGDKPGKDAVLDKTVSIKVTQGVKENEQTEEEKKSELVNETDYWLNEKEFSKEARKKMASTGAAMPDGSFPIRSKKDLENAIKAYGRAKNPAAAKKHIMSRAKTLGHSDLIPDKWKK
jgi:hypothetical protein